jgi:hypothetical protein
MYEVPVSSRTKKGPSKHDMCDVPVVGNSPTMNVSTRKRALANQIH